MRTELSETNVGECSFWAAIYTRATARADTLTDKTTTVRACPLSPRVFWCDFNARQGLRMIGCPLSRFSTPFYEFRTNKRSYAFIRLLFVVRKPF